MGLFLTAFAVGLTFNAAPGPVFAATLRHGVLGGFRPALAVQIGSLVGDGVWAILGLAAVALLGQLEPLRTPIAIAGIAYLSWLAWDSWRASTQHFTVPSAAGRDRAAVRSGALLSLTNPQNVGYWAALGTSVSALGVRDPGFRDYAVFFAGFMASSLVWSFVFAGLVHWLLGNASARWARVTYRACAVMFVALALASVNALRK
jgi:chemosensory pili system protein ChpE/L-lysine exporter family protein LysE/ArgO